MKNNFEISKTIVSLVIQKNIDALKTLAKSAAFATLVDSLEIATFIARAFEQKFAQDYAFAAIDQNPGDKISLAVKDRFLYIEREAAIYYDCVVGSMVEDKMRNVVLVFRRKYAK